MQSLISGLKFRIIFGAWWFTWAQLQMIALYRSGVPFNISVTDSLITNSVLAGVCLLIAINMRFYLPGKERVWYVLIVSLVMSLISLFTSKFILEYIYSADANYLRMLGTSQLIRFGNTFLLTGCMSIISMLWYTLQEQQETEKRKTEAEKLAREAELFKLRQQLQPHFLFNSLNSISALTGIEPEKARHMIQQLSDFLRGTLRKDEMQWTTLKEELEYLQLYLDIEKVRFGYRLQTAITCPDEVLALKLPSLLLQPVVENAIKFGLYDTTGEVTIEIKAASLDNTLQVTVSNPFDPETAQPLHGTGFGLTSVKRRLYLLFARQDLLQTTSNNNQFITTITIPQQQ